MMKKHKFEVPISIIILLSLITLGKIIVIIEITSKTTAT